MKLINLENLSVMRDFQSNVYYFPFTGLQKHSASVPMVMECTCPHRLK